MFCALKQWKISRLVDEEKPLGARLDAHIDECDSCNRFYLQSVAMAEALRSEAGLSRHRVSSELHNAVMLRCSKSANNMTMKRCATVGRPRITGIAVTSLAAAAVIVVVFAIWAHFSTENPTGYNNSIAVKPNPVIDPDDDPGTDQPRRKRTILSRFSGGVTEKLAESIVRPVSQSIRRELDETKEFSLKVASAAIKKIPFSGFRRNESSQQPQ